MTLSTGNRRAFTLVELLLILMILSVLAGLSLPRFSRTISAGEFKDFVSKFYLFLDYGRSYAVLKNKPCALSWRDRSVAMCDDDGNCTRLNIPESIDTAYPQEQAIVFFPDGTAQPFEITIHSRAGDKSILFSRGFDGRIMIKDNLNNS